MMKQLIALGIRKLLEHTSEGVITDIAETMIDTIADSRSNNAPFEFTKQIKSVL